MGNYVPASEEETKEMLDFLGLSSVDDLYRDVPRDVYRSRLPLPAGAAGSGIHPGARPDTGHPQKKGPGNPAFPSSLPQRRVHNFP